MEPEPIKQRLNALDGLRGIAIILVLLSHLDSTILFDKGSNLLLKTIFGSGEIGVSILFILSGFLMAYLYPQPRTTLSFLQKRYTRIFPTFIAICLLLSIVSLNPQITKSIPQSLFWLFSISLLFHLAWVFHIKKMSTKAISWIFKSFLILQVAVAAFYLFGVMRMDNTMYIASFSEATRVLITFFVNATLTLPLGTYSGPLSDVYWSLGTEVYFYILYPIIAVPFIAIASKTNKKIQLILLASTLPVFIGLYFISQKFLFFKLLHLELAYYFVGGLALGYFYHNQITRFNPKKLSYTLLSKLSIPLFIGSIIIYHALIMSLPVSFGPFIKTLFTIPLSLIVLATLIEQTTIAKVLNTKALIHIGTISYSMYLIHIFIFEIINNQFGEPTDYISLTLFILISICFTILASAGIYYLLEKPYFIKRKDTSDVKNEIKKDRKKNHSIAKILILITLTYFITTFFAYNSHFKLFSLQSNYQIDALLSPQTNATQINLNQNPLLKMQLKAKEDNLAVIEFDLAAKNILETEFTKQTITARLKEIGTENWQKTEFIITSRDDEIKKLFGFAPIENSKGKIYDLELSIDKPESSYTITLNTKNELIIAHYTLNKTDIFNPLVLLKLIVNKANYIIKNPTAQLIFLLYIPFLLTSLFIINKYKK